MPDILGCMFAYACNYDENANLSDGSCYWPSGCDQVCGSTLEDDECGVCGGNNDCVDCNGDPFGNAVYDKCGEECIAEADDPSADCSAYCDSDYTNDCLQDCNGIWGGDALEDMCGTCDNNTSNDCVQDCADVWGGTGEIDLFGVCCTETEDNECIITGCDLPDSTLYLTETSMAFNSSKAIKQILLTMEGSVIPSYPLSGAAGDAGFVWLGYSNSSNWVFGKDQTYGTSIPAGSCGNLVNIEYLNTPVSISAIIKDENDTVIGFSAYFDSGCSEESACNYNPYSVNDVDGACVYIDECGECGGPGPDEGLDCDGNELAIINPGLIPETYNIHNIYPNPFDPVTNIEFGLPENTFVRIIVYDIKGRQIATLMNSFQFAGFGFWV